MKKSLHTAKAFIALFLTLTLILPIISPWNMSVQAAGFTPETIDEVILGDCVSRGYSVDAFDVETFTPMALAISETLSAGAAVGSIVRTWGSQFALSSAAEWAAAQNAVNPAGGIVINSTIGFDADPTVVNQARYQRDERGALTLAPGVLTATYETVPFAVNNFTHMINSFGADTPDGTWIEVWVRAGRSVDELETVAWLPTGNPTPAAVHVTALRANAHSAANLDAGFLTSGRWSPFSQDFERGIRRTTSTSAVSGGAQQATGSLIVSGVPANVVQYRVTLHRDSVETPSPVVRHVHGTTRNAQIDQTSQPKEFPTLEFPARNFNGQAFPGGNTDRFPTLESIFAYLEERPIDMERQGWDRGSGDSSVVLSPGAGRGIYMQGFPMRSQQATGPILGGVNCSAVTIGMIVNGFLNMEGITPYRPMEEIGLNLFDYQLNGFGNWQFTVAGAGTYGLRAHVEYNDRNNNDDIMMETILRHLLSGHALGLSLTFSSDPAAPNFIPRTDGTTGGHLIVLLGVVQRSGNWYVISYEPWSGAGANANNRVYRELPMQNLVNAMRHTGAGGTHNIIYVVKPGVEPGAGTAAPERLNSYLVSVAPGELALSTDGTPAGIIPISGMDRGQIGGPSGFVAYTTESAFNFMGTTINNPHGQAGTKFRYLPLGDTIRFGYDAHIAPPQPFTYEQLTDPNFRMYIMMGNGFTHIINNARVPGVNELHPELYSTLGEFTVNNNLLTVAPGSLPIIYGTTTVGSLRNDIEATFGGEFFVFPSGTVINTIADFTAALASQKLDNAALTEGDFIIVVNSLRTVFSRFEIDHFGLNFEHSQVGELVFLGFYEFTQAGSSAVHPWSNRLVGWQDPNYPDRTVVYTADRVALGTTGGPSLDTFPSASTDADLRSIVNSGVGSIPMRFVEADAAYSGGFRLMPTSTTGEMLPWRGPGTVRITATVSNTDSNDPFNGQQRSFYATIRGGGIGSNGGMMSVGEYETGVLIPSFTWGTFRVPVEGERTYNLIFHNSIARDYPGINIDGRPLPAVPIPFPYTPYENDRPYWTLSRTWDGTSYNSAANNSRVSWFWQPEAGARQPVTPDAQHGYVFQPGTVYIAELVLTSAMLPANNTWNNLTDAEFSTFVANIAGVPEPGEGGISSITFTRQAGWLLLVTLTFEQLPGERPDPGPIDQLSFEHSEVGETVSLTFYDVTREGSPNFYPWVNRLTGWDGPGHVVYTVSSNHASLVDADLNIVTSNRTGAIMPFLGNAETSPVIVTATIHAENPEDPFDGLSVSYGVWVRAGGYPGANGRPMRAGEGFTWGTFTNPVVGERAFSVAFSNTEANAFIPFNSDPIPEGANVVFPYVPYANERPLFTFGQTWGGTAYSGGTAHGTRIAWFRDTLTGVEPVPQGHIFTEGTVYIAEMTLASAMTAGNNTWVNFPPAAHAEGNTFAVFAGNARGLPAAGQNGISAFDMWQGRPDGAANLGWNMTFRLTFEPLGGTDVDFGLNIFNNGLGGSPSTANAGLAAAGTIRLWTQIDGANALVPYADLEVTAELPDGTNAMEFVRINNMWANPGNVNHIDVNKNAPWARMTLTVALNGNAVEVELVNSRYLGLVAFNNGTDSEVPSMAGTIRIWPQLAGTSAPIPMAAVITAVDQDGNDAMEFVTANRVWTDAGWANYNANFDVTKDAPWETILFTVTVYGQTVSVLLINDWFSADVPVFGLDIFNNGLGGSPSRPNDSLAAGGTIRIWTQLDGVSTLVPYADLTVTAEFPDGTNAMEFVRVNNMWNNPGNVNLIDVSKNGGAWEKIILTADLNGQEVELILVNALFSIDTVSFGLQAFNNGTSTQIPSLAGIRIWTQLDGANALVPYADLQVTATLLDGTNAIQFVRVNNMWANPGNANFIDVSKNGNWQYINFTASLLGQTVELLLINDQYVQ